MRRANAFEGTAMSIELHCPQCSKLIRAPAGAGGKHGKCPYCGNSVYVPLPPEEVEEIPLAPIGEEEEQREEQLQRESAQFAAFLDHGADGAAPASPGAEGRGRRTARQSDTPGKVIDLASEVKRFVVAMHDSKLDEAEAAAAKLKQAGTRARDYIEGLLLDEMPPQFDDVPPPLVRGFLKTLEGRLS